MSEGLCLPGLKSNFMTSSPACPNGCSIRIAKGKQRAPECSLKALAVAAADTVRISQELIPLCGAGGTRLIFTALGSCSFKRRMYCGAVSERAFLLSVLMRLF